MYQVLYRKWRPKCFEDVYGQPQVTVTLKNELVQNRIAHAYLFTGSRGTGKTSCAKILAKAVNCLNPKNGDPCGECEICKGLENETILDVVEIDAASNNSVTDIRDLRDEVNFLPSVAKYRVYIIDEVHMLTTEAFNALLKTLEEPPAHVIFILATTEVHKIPATILSRCQRFDFNRIAPEEIAKRLKFVAEQENATIEDDAALMIGRIADGAMRDSLSLLDQCFSRNKNVTIDVVVEAAGLTGRDHLYDISRAIAQGDSASIINIIEDLHNNSKDMYRLCDELILHFRNIMLFKTMKNPSQMLVLPEKEIVEIENQATMLSMSTILHAISTMQDSLSKIKSGINARIEMEMALIMLSSPKNDSSNLALIRRIETLERYIDGSVSPKKSVNNTQLVEEKPKKDEVPVVQPTQKITPPPQKEAVRLNCWADVLNELHSYLAGFAAFFNDSVGYVVGDYLLIDAPNTLAFEVLRNSQEKKEKLRQAIFKVTGKSYKLGPYKKDEYIEKSEDDPLLQLANDAKNAGIDVKITQ